MKATAALIAGAMLVTACRSNRGMHPVEAARTTVEQSIDDGVRTTTNRDAVTITVRYNPADCECPEWEVFAFGRWMRVFLEPESAASGLQTDPSPLATAQVTGRFAESSRFSERNVRYPVFVASD